MNNYLQTDEWNIIEEGFHADKQCASESIFSLANGQIGQRANFEETYSSDSMQGSYAAGITFWDETVVGWWKNGLPHHYSCTPNSPNWSGIRVRLIDEEIDMAQWEVDAFRRELHMRTGILERTCQITSPKDKTVQVQVERFNSMDEQNLCIIKYQITSVNYKGKVSLIPFIDGDVTHESANLSKKPWNIIKSEVSNNGAYIWTQIKRETTQMCCACQYQLFKNEKEITKGPIKIEKDKLVGYSIGEEIKPGETLTLYKYTTIESTLYIDRNLLVTEALKNAQKAKEKGWLQLKEAHKQQWTRIWDECDVTIEGDAKAQQAIRYNIFQLLQTYQGKDPRLNIAAKGFTGEKYGGNTYWNTELCCVPFMLLSVPFPIAKNLLLYRYHQLGKAIKNAELLGFTKGAALYPMVTANGEECHNEWEITFEEIHRNSIIVYAIDQYVRYTGDHSYVVDYGLEVMIAIARFWQQRVSFSTIKNKYVLLGVTGPNEYENNVNNNWYTNYGCVQCLKLTLHYLQEVAEQRPTEWANLMDKVQLQEKEIQDWQAIVEDMYFPVDQERDLFLQEDGYLDKELKSVEEINPKERPINQYWSWDRILRSCFIKQSDVLLGIYLYYTNFSEEQIKNNFHFYEPKTLHESSLSPFVHAILAARIGELEKAYSLFMQSTRIDLDDYNNEVEQGLHITSMAGGWLAIVEGFAGMTVKKDQLHFHPQIPKEWRAYSFRVNFMKNKLFIRITDKSISFRLEEGEQATLYVNKKKITLIYQKALTLKI
ncbi:MAG: family 65 glycosyl hydrolase domain-containing protein [Bacteroidaceae bacterium]|nr:family 65 glycosyl hydrolase domain-containing protein [Bacteroidaceae bacterium]